MQNRLVGRNAPARHRGRLSVTGGVGMGRSLNRPPVVASGKHHRINTIHYALVVGGGAVWVIFGEQTGFDDTLCQRQAIHLGRG